jgi:hypothetical protein
MSFIRFFLQVILVLLVFSCKNPNQNIHGAVDPEDLVRLASAVVTFGPFPGHLSQTRRPPRPPAGLLPDVGDGIPSDDQLMARSGALGGPRVHKEGGVFWRRCGGDSWRLKPRLHRCIFIHVHFRIFSVPRILDVGWISGCLDVNIQLVADPLWARCRDLRHGGVGIGLNPFDLFDACWSKGVKHLEFSPTEERTESMANHFHGCFYPKKSVTHISMALCCGLVLPICIVAFMPSFRIPKFHHGCDKFEPSAFLSNTHSHHIRTYQLWSLQADPSMAGVCPDVERYRRIGERPSSCHGLNEGTYLGLSKRMYGVVTWQL